VQRGGFVPAAQADNAGTGPYRPHPPEVLPEVLPEALPDMLPDDESTRL